jgi:hypothetical protein
MGNRLRILLIIIIVISGIGFMFYNRYKDKVAMKSESIWSIGIYKGKDPLHIAPADDIRNPVFDASMVTDVQASFVADPFLWKKDSLWYLFFEVLNKKDMKGDIGYACSKDLKKWTYGKIIIDCKYHLSYPYVFEWNDSMFLIPESAEAGFLSLYYAKDFPEKWELIDTLLHGNFGDHAIVRYKNEWWLYAGAEPHRNNILKLYHSENLHGKWIEHPLSPIVKNRADIARPGGRMLIYNNNLVRFTQNCKKTYGKEVNAYIVRNMDANKYDEVAFKGNPIIEHGKEHWALHGMHQVDAWQIQDSLYIAAVDGYNKKITLSLEF